MTETKSKSIKWCLSASTSAQRLGRLSWLADMEHDMTEELSNILLGEKVPYSIANVNSGDVIVPANKKLTKTALRDLVRRYLDHALENEALLPIYAQFGAKGPHLSPWHFDGGLPANAKILTLLFEKLVRSDSNEREVLDGPDDVDVERMQGTADHDSESLVGEEAYE